MLERNLYLVNVLKLPPDAEWMENAVWLEPAVAPVLNQITGRLFSQFQFRDGEVSLAGCHLEPRLILVACRISLNEPLDAVNGIEAATSNPAVSARIESVISAVDVDGVRLSDSEISALKISEAVHAALLQLANPEVVKAANQEQQLKFEQAVVDMQLTADKAEVNFVCVLIDYWIEGKFQFRVAEQAVESQFCGWVTRLMQQPSLVQPYVCPLTHMAGKELATDDEGDISVSNGMDLCSITHRRLLLCKLSQCVNSQQLASRHLMIGCTDGSLVIPTAATYCQQCGLPVAKELLATEGVCPECRLLNAKDANSDPADLLWINRLVATLELSQDQLSELKYLKMVRANQLTWLHFQRNKQNHLFVFDSQEELIAQRIQTRWRKRWKSSDGKNGPRF